MNDGIEQADDLAQLLAAQAPSRKDVEVEALQYGYNGMFSDRPTVKEAAEYLEYARSVGDPTGIVVGMQLVVNTQALIRARKNLIRKDCV